AAEIAERFPTDDLRGVAAQVSANARTAPMLVHARGQADSALTDWRAGLDQVVDLGPRPQLLTRTIADARTWIDEHLAVLTLVRHVVGQLDDATSRVWTVDDARRVLTLRRSVDEALAAIDTEADRHRLACGPLYDGVTTDLAALRSAAAWGRDLQFRFGGPLNQEQSHALDHAVDVELLRPAAAEWRAKRADVVEAFESSRHAELAEELEDADNARNLLRALQQDTGGQHEWRSYEGAVTALRRHGLREAVDFCAREQLGSHEVRDVIEKAVLSDWVEHHLATDPALQPARAPDRDAVVAEFRELDQRVVATAVGSIVEACNANRPRSILGGPAALITREAEKKRKHMPVRELVHRARNVAQAIKPCFMMSPLAVSQYLPPDITFDVVIFDEASQVAPMDAINCIYRGTALITAGDAKQLPPTNFFALAGDDDDEWDEESDDAQDFESILDLAKSSGSFRSLTLRWHYRSRHESLIAYSNRSFYEGKLVTFPGADHEGPDVGVELIPVQGVYRRGSSRDNAVEAQKVAELVLHHYDTRPGRSVGVVTFSEAQAATIEAAVEE
ncbi:MAG: hypothetical protein L0K86_26865, partial [Actinomycetia bacterium]|nr:hypothetical protein [Actinomycetes bacterium]